MDKRGGEPVAEAHERVGEFVKGDVARGVGVEAVEEGAPGGEEAPEAATNSPKIMSGVSPVVSGGLERERSRVRERGESEGILHDEK